MRLVCDHCNAVHTIEDRLVGTRDFRVSCKTCQRPILVKGTRQLVAQTQRVRPPGASLPPPSLMASAAVRSVPPEVPSGRETWFVSIAGRQQGPHTAEQLASMLERGRIDWSTEVWREGLKGWRSARRDALLVTSVAGARGVANDTTRLNAAKSFLAAETRGSSRGRFPCARRALKTQAP